MEILKIESLTKVYGSGQNKIYALDGISFTVEKGEFISVIGPSGSGKSTLLHILGGVEAPSFGKIYIDGKDIFENKREEMAIFRRRQIGLIYQSYNLIPTLNAEQNIALPLMLDGKEINQTYLSELLDSLNLKNESKYLPRQLSGGQQQRVAIGRALANTPALILADEPTGNLDSRNGQAIIELLKYSNKRYKQTLIMITHEENIALQADRMIEICDGKIKSDQVLR